VSDERVKITVAGTEGAEGDDLGVVVVGDVGHRNHVFVDIHSDIKPAKSVHIGLVHSRSNLCMFRCGNFFDYRGDRWLIVELGQLV
jgi:hypothetical protein